MRTLVAYALVAVVIGPPSIGAQPKGTRTAITGTLVKAAGVQMIYIESMK